MRTRARRGLSYEPQNRQAGQERRRKKPFYRFRLFVADDEPNSLKAKAVIARLCDTRLKGRCEVRIVDVFEDYQAAIDNGVIVVPTLIVDAPPPAKTIVGSLADEEKVLALLGPAGEGERS
jgi:circadian clock protein KaiB